MLGAHVSHSYEKSAEGIGKHIDYIAFRDREGEGEELGMFSEHQDKIDVEAFKELMYDKRTQHSEVATAHKLLFTMSGDEWDRSGFQPGDYQNIIRDVMKEWELKKGYRLQWAAAEHRNPDHPHVHLVIKATYTDRDGVDHRLKLTDADRKFFRTEFDKAKDRVRGFELPPKEPEFKKDMVMSLDTSLLDSLLYQINRQIEEEEMERERQQSRNR